MDDTKTKKKRIFQNHFDLIDLAWILSYGVEDTPLQQSFE